MPEGLGGGVAMAQQVRQGRQVRRPGQPSINLPREQGDPLEEASPGAKRQLSAQAIQAGTVGRGRSLKTLGGQRRLGGGLGNRALGRFRRPQ